ncbi:MAG: hypothetical protein ABI411_05120 [Tahibacter sp.]
MAQFRAILLWVLTFLLVLLCGVAVWSALSPPYSDREILESVVDTWEAETMFTAVFLVLLFGAAGLAAFFGFAGRETSGRRLAVLAFFLAIISAGLQLFNHAALADRVTQLTDQHFGTFYGLL